MSQRLHASKHSINDPETPHRTPTTHPELEELDARLKRITDDFIQPTPYILTVPSERPYHLDPRLPHDWQRDTPFEENEESLQYLSFLADWDNGLIKPVSGWMEYYEKMERTESQQSVKSGVSGVGGGAKKIKYSLSDYKKKAAGQPVAGDARGSGEPTKVNGTSAARRGSSSSRQGDRGVKRSREDGEISEASEDIPLKRRRSTPSESAAPFPSKSKSAIPKLELPPEISPTLPPIFERELARLSKLDRLDSTAIAKSGDPPLEKRKLAEKGVSSTKSDSVDRRKDDSKPRPKGIDHTSSGAPNGVPAKVKQEGAPNGPSKLRKIVKIRIPKSIRNNVTRLLKIPPRSQKKSDAVHKGVARKIERSPPPRDRSNDREKRRRGDGSDGDDEHRTGSIKRAKHPTNFELSKPNTPSNSAFRSPAVSSQTGNQKPSITSELPGKTLTVPRDDGGGASTPSGGHRNGTPTAPDSVERPSKDGRPTSRAQRSAAYSELRVVERDLFTLGRSSKHSSDRELNTETSPKQPHVMRGLAFGLECILSFMLSYSVRDEMNRLVPPGSENAGMETWSTIFPYIQRIKRVAQTNDHKHLYGLCLQLEAVCHLAVWNSEVDRAASADQHRDSPPSTTTLMKHYHSATTLFIDGAAALPVETLQYSFPRTWKGKSAMPLASPHRTASSAASGNGASSSSAATKFDSRPIGDFALPITSITTGVEAVRAGRALLLEWCDRQKVDWTPSLGRKKKDKDEREKEK